MTRPIRFQLGRSLAAIALLAALGLVGCGEVGPKLYPLSGEVTYMGKAVKAGTIHFEPAGGKANPRAITRADIQNGRYELPRNKGVMGGPYTVIISPTDGIAQAEEPLGKALFPNAYVAKVDLPQEASTKNFDIPSGGR